MTTWLTLCTDFGHIKEEYKDHTNCYWFNTHREKIEIHIFVWKPRTLKDSLLLTTLYHSFLAVIDPQKIK